MGHWVTKSLAEKKSGWRSQGSKDDIPVTLPFTWLTALKTAKLVHFLQSTLMQKSLRQFLKSQRSPTRSPRRLKSHLCSRTYLVFSLGRVLRTKVKMRMVHRNPRLSTNRKGPLTLCPTACRQLRAVHKEENPQERNQDGGKSLNVFPS